MKILSAIAYRVSPKATQPYRRTRQITMSLFTQASPEYRTAQTKGSGWVVNSPHKPPIRAATLLPH